MKATQPIALEKYCPKTPYGLSTTDILLRAVNHEDHLNNAHVKQVVPKDVKYPESSIPKKKTVGMWNFFRNSVVTFADSFNP